MSLVVTRFRPSCVRGEMSATVQKCWDVCRSRCCCWRRWRPRPALAAQPRRTQTAGAVRARRRSEPGAAGPVDGRVPAAINGRTLLMGGLVICALGLLFGLMTFTQLKNLPVHRVDARGVRADLRDVQDLPDHAGQVHPAPRGLHRRDHGVLLRRASQRLEPFRVVDHPALQPDRHRRQLRRRLVRHPRQHVRQLARGVRQPARQAVPDLRHSAARRHEHRHAAHQRRAAADALHPAVHPGRLRRAPASSASPSASRSARRRCASPAASSRRSPTSART